MRKDTRLFPLFHTESDGTLGERGAGNEAIMDWFECLFVFLLPLCLPNLQFNLSVGIIGIIYFTIPVTYGLTNIFIGLLTDRLVRSSYRKICLHISEC